MIETIVAPHSLEAEQALLGAMLSNPGVVDRIGDLPTEAFFRDDHRRIYATILKQIARGKPADVVTVFAELGEEEAERVGGLAYLGDLATSVTSSANAARYAEIIRERALLRGLLAAVGEIQAAASEPGVSAKEKVDEAQARIMALSDAAAFGARDPVHMREAMREFLGVLEKRMEKSGGAGVSTGFPDIDARIPGGMDEGWFVVLAGRPGMGKSALALQIADAFAKQGHTALYLSQEMPGAQLAERLTSIRARTPIETLRSGGDLTHEQHDGIAALAAELDGGHLPLYLDEQPALRLADVKRKCRQVKRTAGLRLVVIDYLQLMAGEKEENRTRELTTITAALKALAKELKITVVALSQLNRSLEARPNKRPIMSDLRESGSIEQDADLVAGIYRDEIYNEESIYAGLAELLFLKHRAGRPGGFVPLAFHGSYARFDSMFGDWPQPQEEQPKPRRKGFAL